MSETQNADSLTSSIPPVQQQTYSSVHKTRMTFYLTSPFFTKLHLFVSVSPPPKKFGVLLWQYVIQAGCPSCHPIKSIKFDWQQCSTMMDPEYCNGCTAALPSGFKAASQRYHLSTSSHVSNSYELSYRPSTTCTKL